MVDRAEENVSKYQTNNEEALRNYMLGRQFWSNRGKGIKTAISILIRPSNSTQRTPKFIRSFRLLCADE